ncbi:unnamed protein product [Colias eurytheme]|nr:unnamed protein product [Colias eurytheme]
MASPGDQTDWNKCVYCQIDTDQPLVCPAASKGTGYVSLAENTSTLYELGKLPEDIVKRLKEAALQVDASVGSQGFLVLASRDIQLEKLQKKLVFHFPRYKKDLKFVVDVINRRMQGRDRNRPERGTASESEDGDEFFDADGCRDFEWTSMELFQWNEETFLPAVTGSIQEYNSAYDAFRSYWDDDILGLIVSETNPSKIASSSFQSEWYATNIHEILYLFSFWMMLQLVMVGIIKMPTITSCFSTHPLLMTEVFKWIFTRKRSRALHFVDAVPANPSNDTAKTSDRLYRLRPIILHFYHIYNSNMVCLKVQLL